MEAGCGAGCTTVHRLIDDEDVHHARRKTSTAHALPAASLVIGLVQRNHAKVEEQQDQHRHFKGFNFF